MDVLRGCALLGIFIVNVGGFALPGLAIFFPISTLTPTFAGPHAGINILSWVLLWMLSVGKMRGLFSMLFGAGLILLTERAERRGAESRIADIFLRRNMWLVLIGLIHAYFIWWGDILFSYGVTALLFLFPCRKLSPKTLLTAGVVILFLDLFLNPITGLSTLSDLSLSHKAVVASNVLHSGAPLTAAQKMDMQAWQDRQQEWRPDTKVVSEATASMKGGYLSSQLYKAKDAAAEESIVFYSFGFLDALGMMLLGMALFKNGFLTATLSLKHYATIAVLNCLATVSLVAAGLWKAYSSGFDLITTDIWLTLPNGFARVTGALGISSIILMLIKMEVLPRVFKGLAAVGQTALSNYLLTSIISQVLFIWGPWKLYGQLQYYQLAYVIAGVWAVNLIWSSLWLRHYEFGPAEWLWRSLTYWKIQPMKLHRKG